MLMTVITAKEHPGTRELDCARSYDGAGVDTLPRTRGARSLERQGAPSEGLIWRGSRRRAPKPSVVIEHRAPAASTWAGPGAAPARVRDSARMHGFVSKRSASEQCKPSGGMGTSVCGSPIDASNSIVVSFNGRPLCAEAASPCAVVSGCWRNTPNSTGFDVALSGWTKT